MGNITPTMEIPILNLICHVALESIRNNLKQIVLNKSATSLVNNKTPYKDKGTPQRNF